MNNWIATQLMKALCVKQLLRGLYGPCCGCGRVPVSSVFAHVSGLSALSEDEFVKEPQIFLWYCRERARAVWIIW